MLKTLISWLTGAPVEQVGAYFREKQTLKHELKKAKQEATHELEMARVEAKKAQAAHIANWEGLQIQNSGWKDEFVLLTISYPVYASFIPVLQDSVERGFKILGTTPLWYTGVVITIYLAVYGVRWKYATEIKNDWRMSANGNDTGPSQ